MHDIFLRAINNELAIDQYVYRTINSAQKSDKALLLPRPFKSKSLLDRLEKHHQTYLLRLLCFFWFLIPFPLLVFYFFSRTFIAKLRHTFVGKTTIPVKGKIAIVSGMYSFKLFSEQAFNDYQKIEIASEVPLKANRQSLNALLDVCSFTVIFQAVYYSFQAIIKNRRSLNCSLKFQTFVTYEWVLVYLILYRSKIDIEEIVFTNHYDRWAVLFDGLSLKKAVLFQHGLMPSSTQLFLPYKHKNIGTVYGFDQLSIDFFKKRVIDNELTKYKIKKPEIELSDLSDGKVGKRLLLIGTPYDQDTELMVMKEILEKLEDIVIYIKPHPSYDRRVYTDFSRNYPVILIEDRNLFPKVDVTMSFSSTLAVQYEAMGISNISLQSNSLEGILTKLNTYF